MALWYNSKKEIPQTHILIIGVGEYPFLKGGQYEREQSFDGAVTMRQLTSPGYSAHAFFETVLELENRNEWLKPLGSVEVLISTTDGTLFSAERPLERAGIQNIKLAYRRWRDSCNSHADNVAIFYFCGHGLEKTEQYLLAEDFGEDPENPWAGAFAFDSTRNAFNACKAKMQLFFVDACRKLTKDMILTQLTVAPLENPRITQRLCAVDLVQRATAKNEAAYGNLNAPSVYTNTLISSLRGNAASNRDGNWTLSIADLSAGVIVEPDEDTPPDYENGSRVTNSSIGSAVFLKYREPPDVRLDVHCLPGEANFMAELNYGDPNREDDQLSSPPGPWQLRIKAGICKLHARFNVPQFQHRPEFIIVKPPFISKELKCTI